MEYLAMSYLVIQFPIFMGHILRIQVRNSLYSFAVIGEREREGECSSGFDHIYYTSLTVRAVGYRTKIIALDHHMWVGNFSRVFFFFQIRFYSLSLPLVHLYPPWMQKKQYQLKVSQISNLQFQLTKIISGVSKPHVSQHDIVALITLVYRRSINSSCFQFNLKIQRGGFAQRLFLLPINIAAFGLLISIQLLYISSFGTSATCT